MKITILDVAIDNITLAETRERIRQFFRHEKGRTVVTPNPEFLLLARRDEEFRAILNGADLSLPDGVGLFFAAWIFRKRLKERITGVRCVHLLCEEASHENKTVFFFGGAESIAKKSGEKLQQIYPALRIGGAVSGGAVRRLSDGQWIYEKGSVLATIRQAQPDILFVALGHGKQEKWIADNRDALPSVKIFMGVGGALDYIAGSASWAPAWVRAIGCEWLWRLTHEPKRWKRIFNAVIVFPIVVLYERFFGK